MGDNHVTILKDDLIYFIGGNENSGEGTVEMWEMIWDTEPAFTYDGYGGCPTWCLWDEIVGLQTLPGGLCTSGFWPGIEAGTISCDYYADHPQFKKRLVRSSAHDGMMSGPNLTAFLT